MVSLKIDDDYDDDDDDDEEEDVFWVSPHMFFVLHFL